MGFISKMGRIGLAVVLPLTLGFLMVRASDSDTPVETPVETPEAAPAPADILSAGLKHVKNIVNESMQSEEKLDALWAPNSHATQGFLKIAQEYLGLNISDEQLTQISQAMGDLQKNIHNHYVLTSGVSEDNSKRILKRIAGSRSQQQLIKSLKQLSPTAHEGELVEQMDVVMNLMHQLNSTKGKGFKEIFSSVLGAVGIKPDDINMGDLEKHMSWAEELLGSIFGQFTESAAKNGGEL